MPRVSWQRVAPAIVCRVVAGHAGRQKQVAYECFQGVRGHTGLGLVGSVHVLSLQYPVVAGVQPFVIDLQPHPSRMRDAPDRTPEIRHQVAVVEPDAAGLSESDLHVFGQEIVRLRLSQGGLGPGVEHDDLAIQIERLQVVAERHAYPMRFAAVVVYGRHPSVCQRDGGADLPPQVGGPRRRPRPPAIVRDGPVIGKILGGTIDVGPEHGVDSAVRQHRIHLVPPEQLPGRIVGHHGKFTPGPSLVGGEDRRGLLVGGPLISFRLPGLQWVHPPVRSELKKHAGAIARVFLRRQVHVNDLWR